MLNVIFCCRYCQPPAKLWDWMEPYLEDEEVSKTMSVILIPTLCSVQLLNCQIIVFFKFLLLEINLQLGSLQYTTVIKMKNLKKLKHLDLSVRPKCNKSACLKMEMLQTVYIYCSLPVCICKEQVQNWENALFLFKKIKNCSCTYLTICLGQHPSPAVYGSFCQRYTSSSDIEHGIIHILVNSSWICWERTVN